MRAQVLALVMAAWWTKASKLRHDEDLQPPSLKEIALATCGCAQTEKYYGNAVMIASTVGKYILLNLTSKHSVKRFALRRSWIMISKLKKVKQPCGTPPP